MYLQTAAACTIVHALKLALSSGADDDWVGNDGSRSQGLPMPETKKANGGGHCHWNPVGWHLNRFVFERRVERMWSELALQLFCTVQECC